MHPRMCWGCRLQPGSFVGACRGWRCPFAQTFVRGINLMMSSLAAGGRCASSTPWTVVCGLHTVECGGLWRSTPPPTSGAVYMLRTPVVCGRGMHVLISWERGPQYTAGAVGCGARLCMTVYGAWAALPPPITG